MTAETYSATTAYEAVLPADGTYAVTYNGFLIGRFRTKDGAVEWSYVAPPWSNEHSTIQSLVRRYPAAQIAAQA